MGHLIDRIIGQRQSQLSKPIVFRLAFLLLQREALGKEHFPLSCDLPVFELLGPSDVLNGLEFDQAVF